MPLDSQAFVSEWKGKSLDGKLARLFAVNMVNSHPTALVEQVRDGSTLRVRLFMPDGEHQMVNIALAGVRSARVASKQREPSEPWGEEVRCPTCISPSCTNFILSRRNSLQSLAFYSVLCALSYSLCQHLRLRLSRPV